MDRAMRMYNYHFFDVAAVEWFVRRTLSTEGTGNPKVFTHDKEKTSVKHVMNRIPVYYGKPMTSMYNGTFTEPEQGAVYCIAGPAKVLQGGYVTIVHGYGINFESKTTSDYKTFVTASGELDLDAVTDELYNRMTLWLGTVDHMFPYSGAHMRMPIIGLGAFASALDVNVQRELSEIWCEELSIAASKYPNITVEVCDFGCQLGEMSPPIVYSRGGDLFKCTHQKDGDDNYIVGNKPLVLLNAWDNMSLIGNGGSRDPTIDGFMVSGSGPNKFFKNTSYLHNPMFNPDMSNRDMWVQIEKK